MIHSPPPSRNSVGLKSPLDFLPAYRMSCGFCFATYSGTHLNEFCLVLVGYQSQAHAKTTVRRQQMEFAHRHIEARRGGGKSGGGKSGGGKSNPNYPSTTGKRSGGGRGNERK